MALRFVSNDGVTATGFDSATGARGFLKKGINRTGGNSVLGNLVSMSTATDYEYIKQANTYDSVGVVAEAGIAEGSEMWIWTTGSRCQVLFKENTASTKGNILLADAVDGRGSDVANPGGGLPGTDVHFSECGHVCQSTSASAGVSNLVLCELHFN